MIIEAKKLGRRFQNDWIFRDLNFKFEQGTSHAITGPNGSGKSTLLKILSGVMPSSEGEIIYTHEKPIDSEDFYKQIVLSAPYLELIEEYTLKEFLNFHFKFKPIIEGKSIADLIEFSYLEESSNKQLKNFSSGMKQRLKLALCFYSNVPVVFLDEPTTNLDEKGISWYHDNYGEYLKQRLIIICSNIEKEFDKCDIMLDMQDFK